jgi:hypothetical protein
MIEPERIKKIEEQITLPSLLPGVNLDYVPQEEVEKLKRALLDVYRISHARGFKAGAEHAINLVASRQAEQKRESSEIQWMMRWFHARIRQDWLRLKKSMRSIRAGISRSPRPPRFPTETLSNNWTARR